MKKVHGRKSQIGRPNRQRFVGRSGTRAIRTYSWCRDVELERLVMVAAETGSRFAREDIEQNPLTWLSTPLKLFGGLTGIECCRSPLGFARAMALHRHSLGLDCQPEVVDLMLKHEQFSCPPITAGILDEPNTKGLTAQDGQKDLYTCSIILEAGGEQRQIFYATVARDAPTVRKRVARQFGYSAESEAEIRLGFDKSHPLACALLSDAVVEMLDLINDEPNGILAEGFTFLIEQRFVL